DQDVATISAITGDDLTGNQILPQTVSRDSDSWFAEFSLPALSNLELSYAIRDEQFSTGQGDVVQKFGIIYTPADWITLRATQGEAFIVPTLQQLNRPESCGLSNVDDLFTTFSGFITSCVTGNPALVSESSDSTSIGIDLAPIDGLTLSLTWSETDFSDRIVRTSSQDIVRTDFANFQRATGFVATDANPLPSLAQLSAWIANPLSDPRIQRDPQNIEITTRIQQSDSNASNMLVKAWDLQALYAFEIGDLGNFRASVNATYVDTYKFQLSQLDPVREAAGNLNNSFGAVAAIPEWRANASLAWSRGSHSANATVRYVDDVIFDANEFSFQQFFPGSLWRHTDVVRAWTQLDVFYSYQDIDLLGGNAAISIGVRNLTDREAQKTGMIAGVVAELQDPRGRVVYARVNYEF
ncbi:MAG: TonB-dependent receptor, partial [Proteobacteria bacterium]|nr:TonB-dependent receptor [Pseudomonadota bacterium]